MKIAIASEGKNINDNVSRVFGRAAYFIIVDIKGKNIVETETIENIYAKQTGRAGVSAVQIIAEKNVEVLIAGNIGPHASDILNQFGIRVYLASGTIKEALNVVMKNENSNTDK